MENEIDVVDEYKGIYPAVFKKIQPGDTKVNPFKAHKTFTFTSGSASSSNFMPLQGIYVSSLPKLETNFAFNGAKNVDNSYKFMIYYSIYHLHYKFKNQPYNIFGISNTTANTNFSLYKSASMFNIPQQKMGEGIKLDSFQYNGSVNLKSDKYGNIYDVAIATGSFPGNEKFYEGFNEYFDTNRITAYTVNSGVTYIDGVSTSNGSQLPIGLAAQFSGSGQLQTDLRGNYDRNHDYAISFFIQSGSNSDTTNELILGKVKTAVSPQYPFKIELSGSNQLLFSAAGSTLYIASITSSAYVSSSWNHVVCQKTGSEMQLYLNATLHSSGSSDLLIAEPNTPFTASATINNDSPLNIGGFGSSTNNLHGDLDEIRIFNKALTQAQITSLADRTEAGGMLQTANIGNVFNLQGNIIMSSPDYRYNNILTTNYTASYKSTVALYEYNTIVRLNAGDMNMSLNPTLLKDNNINYKTYVSGSDFNPYITTIGLYNDSGQLLAIGKLANPIRKRMDMDTNFMVRLDLDKPVGIPFKGWQATNTVNAPETQKQLNTR